MSTILARCAALGIVAGGFALTGDLGRLADRGLKVLNASDVPAATSPDAVATLDAAASAAPVMPVAAQAPAAAAPAMPPPRAIADAPAARPSATAAAPPTTASEPAPVADALGFRPAAGGLGQADITSLGSGTRLVIWLTVARRVGNPAYRCLVFDMVDPAASEALAYEAVSFTADGRPQATATPPRRVRITGGPDGHTVVKGGTLRMQRLGIAQGIAQVSVQGGGDAGETVGPIVALDVIR